MPNILLGAIITASQLTGGLASATNDNAIDTTTVFTGRNAAALDPALDYIEFDCGNLSDVYFFGAYLIAQPIIEALRSFRVFGKAANIDGWNLLAEPGSYSSTFYPANTSQGTTGWLDVSQNASSGFRYFRFEAVSTAEDITITVGEMAIYDENVALPAATRVKTRITDINSDSFTLHEPPLWNTLWYPPGLVMRIAGASGVSFNAVRGFGSQALPYGSSPPGSAARLTWDGGWAPNLSFPRPNRMSTPTQILATQASVVVPSVDSAVVTLQILQVRKIIDGAIWENKYTRNVAQSGGQGGDFTATATALTPNTDYQARWREEWVDSATQGVPDDSDGFALGTPVGFKTLDADNGGGGNPGPDPNVDEAPPAAPGRVSFDDPGSTTHTIVVKPDAFPPRARYLRLWGKVAGGVFAIVAENLHANSRVNRSGLVRDTEYLYYFEARNNFNGGSGTNGPQAGIITNLTDAGGEVPTPNPPTLAKVQGKIRITASEWIESVGTMELRRGTSAAIHSWSAANGTYDDDGFEIGEELHYSVRVAINGVWSAWSADAVIVAISDSCSVTWLQPANDDIELQPKHNLLRFLATDAGGYVLPTIRFRGFALATPTRDWGNYKSGIMSLNWDTRDYANGVGVLRALALGSDGFWSFADRVVSLSNTMKEGTLYNVLRWPQLPTPGRVFKTIELGLQVLDLALNPLRRYWLRNAIIGKAGEVNFVAPGARDEKAEAFAKLQRVTLEAGQRLNSQMPGDDGAGPREWGAVAEVAKPDTDAIWVQQWTPQQFQSAYLTGCEEVVKIRPGADETNLVFAVSPMGGARAGAFVFDGSTLQVLAAFENYGAGDALDACLQDDKIFVVAPGEVFAIDLDEGQATLNLSPRGETRAPRFIEGVGAQVLCLFIDENLPAARTRCYDLTFATPRLLWELDAVVTLAYTNGAQMTIAAGAQWFDVAEIAPVLQHVFPANINAMWIAPDGTDGELDARAFLADGSVWARNGNDWTRQVEATGAPLSSGAAWQGLAENVLGVGGGEGAQLREELANGLWMDARTITGLASGETIARITALASYEREIKPATGAPGLPGYEAAIVERMLLVGTGDSGVFVALQLSDGAGALPVSVVSHLNLDPYLD